MKENLSYQTTLFAGYHRFTEPVPDVGHPIFDVTNYGAIPNDGLSDQKAIQAAIDAAQENGRGVVFFPAGKFLIATNADKDENGNNSSIRIRSSNIVLRGSGSRDGGTIIRQVNQAVASVPWGVWWAIYFGDSYEGSRVTQVIADADRESYWITVASTIELSVGQWVKISTRIIDEAGVNEYLAPRSFIEISGFYREKFNGIVINEIHQIAEISGNRIRFHSPIRTHINATHNFEIYTFSPLEEVGVEDICFQGSFFREYSHDFGNTGLSDAVRSLQFGGYSLVQFSKCVNSWIRRCSFVNVVRGYRSIYSANLSFYQLTTSGNRGHYSALIEDSTSIWTGLIEDVTVDNNTYNHGPSITHNTSGNVYYYSDMDVSKNFDVHASNPSYDNLFDNGSGGHLHGSSGANSPPNHLNRCVIWNYERVKSK